VGEVVVNRERKLLTRAGTQIMLKPLLITTATLFSAAFVSVSTAQVANAATQSHPVQNGHQELIAKSNKSSHISAQQRADIKSIHQVLTEIYRGFNNQNVDLIQNALANPSATDKIYIQRLFKRWKSMNIDVSYEVQSIELLKLTGHTALVKVSESTTAVVRGGTGNALSDTTLTLVKYQGKWKISDGDAVIKSVSKGR
jgi:archaellum component FlaF (FlaF/FlaG flagellin family)